MFNTHHHRHDNSTNIKYPENIKVQEYKAPTDESIRLMEEMHDKAVKNILAKVKVEDNIVNGECWLINQPWNMYEYKICFKFKINDREFTLEKEVGRNDFQEDGRLVADLGVRLKNHAEAVMLWYALKMFTSVMYEKITKQPAPKELVTR